MFWSSKIVRGCLFGAALGACATTDGGYTMDPAFTASLAPEYQAGAQQAAAMSDPNRRGVQNYSQRYGLICAAAGAAIGAGGAQVAGANDTETLLATVAGAGIGYLACSAAGARQERFAYEEQSMARALAGAQRNYEAARSTADSAERLVADHKQELTRLRQQAAQEDAARLALNERIGAAKYDHQLITQMSAELNADIDSLNAKYTASQDDPLAPQLRTQLVMLQQEKQRLDRQAVELQTEIDNALLV